MTRDLRAKLVLEGDNAGLVAAVTQSEAEIRQLEQTSGKVQLLTGAIDSAKAARAALVEARAAAQTLDEQLAAAKGAGAGADAIKLLERALKDANREVATAETAWSKSRAALDAARASAAGAGVDTKNLASEQQRLRSALDAAAQALADNNQALVDARAASAAKAEADKAAAAEEQRLAQIVEATKQRQKVAAQELLEAERKASAEAEAAARRTIAAKEQEAAAVAAFAQRMKQSMADAFSATGVRGGAEIQGEINKINSALGELARNSKVSGTDFDRAWIAGQARIKALQQEIGGIPPKLDAFSGKLNPIAGQIAAAFSVREVALMAAQFDSLNRALNAISGADAAREMGYITSAAARLGLDLQSASKAYVSWLAAVKGSALEGAQARQIFEAVAGAMARLGKSSADTEGALVALGQMVSKGTVSMEELRGQLAEHLPGALQAAAAGAGLTTAQLTKMVESGTVLAEDLLPGLATELNKLYGTAGETQGFAASWNGLTSAVTEAVGRIGQTEVVTKAVAIAFGSAKEVVLVFGTAMLTVAEGIGFTTKAWATLVAALKTGEWSKAKDEIVSMANESATRINELASKTLIAKGVQSAFGQSVKDSADAASTAAPKWLAIKSAYTEVAEAAKKFADQAKATTEARVAEERAINDIAQLLGTEAEKRDAAARFAGVEAEAKRKLAEAADYEAKVSASNLAAMQAEAAAAVAAGQKVSEAKQKEIDALRESNKLKAEAASKAQAEAESATIRAAAAAVEVRAHKENHQALAELREEMQATERAAADLTAAQKAGLATKEQVKAAELAAAGAARVYRSALEDTLSALNAKAALERSSISVQEKGRSLQLAQIDTQIAVAQARGRDLEVQQLQIERARIEMELSSLKAKALRAEADAQLALVAAKRAELEASGQLTEVKRLELNAQEQSAKAKRVDADIADELAKRARQLSDVVRTSGDSMRTASRQAEGLGDSWSSAADKADRLAASAKAVADVNPDGTVNRTQFTSTVDNYQVGIAKGLSPEEAKLFATQLSDEVVRAQVEARGRYQAVGPAFGAKDFQELMDRAEQSAYDYARSAAAKAGTEKASTASGGVSKTVRIELTTASGTRKINVASQSQADDLVRALQEARGATQ